MDTDELLHGFDDVFGRLPEVTAHAPGRVNLIGEHTDYNGGFVLPIALPLETFVAFARRSDRSVRARSDMLHNDPQSFVVGQEKRQGTWLDYIQGVTRILAEEGHTLSGFDVRITSAVPMGSGLSSSAALEVALLRGLRRLFQLPIDDVGIAVLSRRVENDFVGAPVGIMDPMASSLASTDAALFLDTRSLHYEFVAFPPSGEIIVIDSGITHRHAGGEYRTRRAECERAATLLGVEYLCDIEFDSAQMERLPDLLAKRVRHVLTENARVLEAVACMRADDLPALGRLFHASHASMRDDYEVSTAEIDTLVSLAETEPDVFGARLTGGGFGGSVVMVAKRGRAHGAAARIAGEYARRTGKTPAVVLPVSP